MKPALPLSEARARLAHAAVPVRDVEVSAAFYGRLGFVRGFMRRDATGRTALSQMKLVDFFIELIRSDDPAGGGHIGLHVDNAHTLYHALLVHGFMPDAPPRRGETGVDFFFVSDPDGNSIEFVSS